MKRKLITVLFIISLFFTTADAIRLFIMKEKEPETANSKFRYVYLAHKKEKFWMDVARGVKEADQIMGSDTLLVQYKDKENIELYVKDAILSGAKGIIMKGTDQGSDVIKEAVLAGIPVLFYDGDFPESGRTAYVGNDNVELGRMAAQALVDVMGEKGEYLLITATVDAYSQRKRMEGIEEVLSQYPSIICTGIIEDEASLLTLHTELEKQFNVGKPDGIISLEGVSAANLGNLLQNFGIRQNDMGVIVMDLTDESVQFLEDGDYDSIISLDAPQIGYRAVETLNQFYDLDRPIQDIIWINGAIITKKNLSENIRENDDETMEWNSY